MANLQQAREDVSSSRHLGFRLRESCEVRRPGNGLHKSEPATYKDAEWKHDSFGRRLPVSSFS